MTNIELPPILGLERYHWAILSSCIRRNCGLMSRFLTTGEDDFLLPILIVRSLVLRFTLDDGLELPAASFTIEWLKCGLITRLVDWWIYDWTCFRAYRRMFIHLPMKTGFRTDFDQIPLKRLIHFLTKVDIQILFSILWLIWSLRVLNEILQCIFRIARHMNLGGAVAVGIHDHLSIWVLHHLRGSGEVGHAIKRVDSLQHVVVGAVPCRMNASWSGQSVHHCCGSKL